jgi:hypothetical protein
MKNVRSLPLVPTVASLCLMVHGVCYAGPASPAAAPDGNDVSKNVMVETPAREGIRWNFSAGWITRDIGKVGFQTGSLSQNVQLPDFFSDSFSLPPSAGDSSTFMLRTYDNGYVGPDAGTDGGGLFQGTTSRFGYNSDAQNNNNQSLTQGLASGGSATTTSSGSSYQSNSWSEDSDYQTGPYLEGGFQFPINGRVSLGAQLAYSWVGFDSAKTTSTFSAFENASFYSVGLTDTYAVPGSVILPLAPYDQPDANPSPSALPRIFALPQRVISQNATGSDNVFFFNRVTENLDVDLHTINLGPEFQIQGPWNTYLSLSGGATINITPWDAEHTETLYMQRGSDQPRVLEEFRDDDSGTELLWGAYVQTGLGWNFGRNKNWHLEGFARWDWNEDLEGSVGPSTFSVDLDAFSAGVTLGFTF